MLGYIYDIILSPIVTEKTNNQLNNRKYSFSIDGSANKEDIKKSIETIFGVDVEKVNIINTEGKVKRFKGTVGKRSSVKKAIVTIKDGQEINFAKLEDK